jgi:hypothetical protein
MTTQTVHIHTYDYGASLSSATLRNVADDTLVATADTVNEVTADSGLYAAVFGETSVIAAGEYRLRAIVSGKPINRYVTLAGTNNEVVEARSERAAVLDSAVGDQITGIKAKTDNLPSDPADQSLIIAATDAVMTRLGAPAGASMSADIAAVKTETASLLSRLTANAATAIQNLFHMITGTGASSKYTVAALENAPAGGGGGGDATLAKQEEILTRLTEVSISVTGYAQLDIYGVLQLKRGHTATLTFTSDTNNVVSDLSAATTKVFFGIKDAAGRSWLSIEGTKLVNTGLQSVRFTISAALAAAMINGEHFFDVVAVYDYNANTTPKYTSLQPFTSGRAKVTDLYVDI